MPTNQQIFLCHANEDKENVRACYERLRDEGFDPWLDDENLLPGQNWQEEIPQALRASAAVVVFLSKTSVKKKGYVQREFQLAYDALSEIPEGHVFVIPVKLDDCDVPSRFKHLQWMEVPSLSGYDKLIKSIRTKLPKDNSIGASSEINRTIKGACQRRAEEISRWKIKAMTGKSPTERRDAIRVITRQMGRDAGECMAELAWNSRFSAARTAAVDQVATLMGAAAVDWLKEAAEIHYDDACRARAAMGVISIQGIESFGWAENFFWEEGAVGVQHGMSRQMYLVCKSSSAAASEKQKAIKIVRRMLERWRNSGFSDCLLASFVMLSNGSTDDKRLALSVAVDCTYPYKQVILLAIVLRTWPTHRAAKTALERYADSKNDSLECKKAQDFLNALNKGDIRHLNYLLLLVGL